MKIRVIEANPTGNYMEVSWRLKFECENMTTEIVEGSRNTLQGCIEAAAPIARERFQQMSEFNRSLQNAIRRGYRDLIEGPVTK